MADTTTEGLNPEFMAAIMALVNASGGRIWINSGYRSEERQAQLYAAATEKYGGAEAARKYVAPPGKSNHNHGLAVDLGGDLELAHQLAPQFGLSFPMDWEPWHIEPPWARNKRGAEYKDSLTTPPQGRTVDDEPYGSLPHQLMVFQALLKGEDISGFDTTIGSIPGGATSESAPVGGASAGGSAADLYAALKAQGIDPVHAAALVAIAGRESGYKADAHNDNASTGDDSLGIFQINLLNGGWDPFLKENGFTDPRSELLTWDGSVRGAAALFKSSGLNPWGGYKGAKWSDNTDLEAAVGATGGEVTIEQLQAITGEN